MTEDLVVERLPDDHSWWRIADPSWDSPLDPSFAQRHGGRWNPANSFPVLYLNEDLETARLNLALFVAKQPYELDDLREEMRPTLVACSLPREQQVCDAYSRAGLIAVGLPVTYPLDSNGLWVPQSRCQPIGVRAKNADLRGVRARSAQDASGARRELAWFPASTRSVAPTLRTLTFAAWFPPQPEV